MIAGLPDKLRQLRKNNKYSQKHLADLLGISPSMVSGYETGEKTPSTEVLLKIAGLYHCSSDYLLGISRDPELTLIDVTGLTPEEINSLHILIDSIKKGRH